MFLSVDGRYKGRDWKNFTYRYIHVLLLFIYLLVVVVYVIVIVLLIVPLPHIITLLVTYLAMPIITTVFDARMCPRSLLLQFYIHGKSCA